MAVDSNLTMGNFLTNFYFLGNDDENKTESYLVRLKYSYETVTLLKDRSDVTNLLVSTETTAGVISTW